MKLTNTLTPIFSKLLKTSTAAAAFGSVLLSATFISATLVAPAEAGWIKKSYSCNAGGKAVKILVDLNKLPNGTVRIGRIDYNFSGSRIGNKNNFNIRDNNTFKDMFRSPDNLPGNKWRMIRVNRNLTGASATIKVWVDLPGTDPSCQVTVGR